MADEAILGYLRQNAPQYDMGQLKGALIQQGHDPAEVEAAAAAVEREMSQRPPTTGTANTVSGKATFPDLLNIDVQTKETITASVVGMLFANFILFFGDFLTGKGAWFSILSVVVSSVIGGGIAGFIIAKLYYPFMDFVSANVRFLLPVTDTFFKLLFVPVVIFSLGSILLATFAGAALFLIGSGIGGTAGGAIGGLLGGSLLLMVAWSLIIAIIGRYVYAKYMVSKVGNYYRDYGRRS